MSIAFVAFGCILLLTTPLAVELSVCMGVGSCLCPNSSSVVHIGMACFALMKRAPSLASAAEDITVCMILAMLRTVPLLSRMGLLVDRKKWPPAQLCAFGSLR